MRGFDALAFGAFSSAGLADSARFTAPGGVEQACTVLLDEGVQQFTDDDPAPVPVLIDRITLQLAEVSPRSGAVVRIVGTGKQFKLVQKLRADGSTEQWEVASA